MDYVGQREEDIVDDIQQHIAPDFLHKDNYEEMFEKYREEVLEPAAEELSQEHAMDQMPDEMEYEEAIEIDRTMFEDVGHIQTGIGIIGADFPEDISKKIQDNLIQVSDNFNYSQDLWSWVGGFNITNPDRYLGPHTDEYEYVKQTNPNAGILKVLLYS